MRVQSLKLVQFRNYADLTVEFSPSVNLFLGNNGQGKTNLLEALYLLSHARSHRTKTDRELIRTGASFATVSAQLGNHHYESRILLEAQIRLDEGRLKTGFKANGNPLRSRSDVLGYLPTVSFFLPDLLLLRGAPEDRRRWLDAAIVQYDKRHLNYLAEFNQVRQQKNRLLKEPPERISREHLITWNIQFAATGARLMASRLQYLAMMENLAAVAYLELSDGQEALTMAYDSAALKAWKEAASTHPHPTGTCLPDATELEGTLAQLLEARMSEEIRRGTSLVGPHRDDIVFSLNEMEASAYGSQGQQRSVVLALKLAELKCLTAKLQEPPVLLLDDVMAELDPGRQRLLVEHMHPDSQVFITTTHPSSSWQELLERQPGDTSSMGVFRVEAGHVSEALATVSGEPPQ